MRKKRFSLLKKVKKRFIRFPWEACIHFFLSIAHTMPCVISVGSFDACAMLGALANCEQRVYFSIFETFFAKWDVYNLQCSQQKAHTILAEYFMKVFSWEWRVVLAAQKGIYRALKIVPNDFMEFDPWKYAVFAFLAILVTLSQRSLYNYLCTLSLLSPQILYNFFHFFLMQIFGVNYDVFVFISPVQIVQR